MDSHGDNVSPHIKEAYAKAVVEMLPYLADRKSPKGYVSAYTSPLGSKFNFIVFFTRKHFITLLITTDFLNGGYVMSRE